MRVCKGCELEKNIEDFPHSKGKPNSRYCKKCFYIKYRDTSIKCSRKYYNENKDSCIKKSKEYRDENKDQLKESKKKYYESNKEHMIYKNSIYCKNNRERRNELARKNYHQNNHKDRKNEYVKEKLDTDPFFKLKFNIRSLIRNAFKRGFTDKSKKTVEILGCSFDEFKLHIESQFDENMNWENQGSYWHMDHIIPISSAETEEDVYRLNHYTNFQPLYWLDNIRKGDKL
jgi:hypothetical protein